MPRLFYIVQIHTTCPDDQSGFTHSHILMIGILVQLVISWLLVFFIERKSLAVLGFTLTKKRVSDLGLFFLITGLCCAMEFFIKIISGAQHWQLNPKLSWQLLLEGIWWNIKSVLFEELIFRGVLLYIMIKRLGAAYAIVISAVAFGIYHWFSFGIIGNASQMAYVFIITGIMGLLLAYAYNKTFSLYIPIGIHLGWNLVHTFIFSSGPIGNGVFIPTTNYTTNSWTVHLSALLLPMVTMLVTNFVLLRRRKQQRIP